MGLDTVKILFNLKEQFLLLQYNSLFHGDDVRVKGLFTLWIRERIFLLTVFKS